MRITAIYAALLGFLFIFLAVRVIGARRTARVGLGDGGDAALMRRMRVHGNFAEYTPMALVLLALAESLAAPGILLHLTGAMLLAGRAAHAWGVSQPRENFRFRVAGMIATFSALGTAAILCLWRALLA